MLTLGDAGLAGGVECAAFNMLRHKVRLAESLQRSSLQLVLVVPEKIMIKREAIVGNDQKKKEICGR